MNRGHELVEIDGSTPSTQEDAKRLARLGCAHGTGVIARRQSEARGRRGRRWASDHDGLWLSVVLRLRLPMLRAPRLPIAACAAVMQRLRDDGLDVWIKWPNDILVPVPSSQPPSPILGPYRKAGGLLVEVLDLESTLDGPVLRSCVVGLGLNLWPPPEGFVDDLRDHAGALTDVGFSAPPGDDDARLTLARRLVAAVAGSADDTGDGFGAVLDALRERSATLSRRVTVDGRSGRADDFDADGALVIVDDDGLRHVVNAGDVALLG